MGNFFFKLAGANVRRNRNVYIPYIIAVAIISGVFFLTCAIIFSDGVKNMPGGATSQMVLTFAVVVFGLFSFCFMLYINGFLIKRRKREFGLYSVLGLEKSHVSRVLLIENLLTLGAGVGLGFLMASIFGRLIFMLLLYWIHSTAGSLFELPSKAFLITGILFGAIFLVTSLYNTAQVRLANPIALLQSERKGEKESKLLVPAALFGVGGIVLAYFLAQTVQGSNSLMLFFPLAALVILATIWLFRSGSIVVLRMLRKNKKLYYKPDNFISISGMFQRMKQNASGLAVICILGTMLVVTVCLSTSLYINQEASLRSMHPFDVDVYMQGQTDKNVFNSFDAELGNLSQAYHVTLSYNQNKLINQTDAKEYTPSSIIIKNNESPLLLKNSLVLDGVLMFDMQGKDADIDTFLKDLRAYFIQSVPMEHHNIQDIFSDRQNNYGFFGGLIFAGAFFAVLFLTLTVLIIYFKQITEGYEDKDRFIILQKVGMDDHQVKTTINRQILWVFFIPLAGALINAAFSTRLIVKILELFNLYDSAMTAWIMVITCAVFSAVYLIAYRLTTKTYYKIVKWA